MTNQELYTLNAKVSAGNASSQEKDLYMEELYQRGSISQKQYDSYKKGEHVDSIIQAALIVGGILLLGYVVGKLVS